VLREALKAAGYPAKADPAKDQQGHDRRHPDATW
jgi:hypothetical protein